MLRKTPLALLIVFLVCAGNGCYKSATPRPGDGTERDPDLEIDWWPDPYPDPYYDPLPDPVPDPYEDPYTDIPPPPCPVACMDIPSGGEIGAACNSSYDCDHAAYCFPESVEIFDGQMYVNLYQGSCILYGAGAEACDPEVPETCPAGSRCIFMGTSMEMDIYGCLDECEPTDRDGNPYEYNCGCRTGYACDLSLGVCMSGCSNDRECCERWWDENGDTMRQPDEVTVIEGCTNICDNGGLFDDTTPEPEPCTVSFSCVNNGDTENHWGGPCEGDAWCPSDGLCLDEYNYQNPWTGMTYYPGGYCTKFGCELIGRGCSDYGGACANLGYADDPLYACLGTCRFGRTLDDPFYECRNVPGQEQACVPVEPDFWQSPPAAGQDGYCWPGNFPGGDQALGGACALDEDCQSPFGLGICLDFPTVPVSPFCSSTCSRQSAIDYRLCGGGDPAIIAAGACWSGFCWKACNDPGGDLGSNGCSSSRRMACYPTSLFGSFVYVGAGLIIPIGLCIPPCSDDGWCTAVFGIPMTCNTRSGVCE